MLQAFVYELYSIEATLIGSSWFLPEDLKHLLREISKCLACFTCVIALTFFITWSTSEQRTNSTSTNDLTTVQVTKPRCRYTCTSPHVFAVTFLSNIWQMKSKVSSAVCNRLCVAITKIKILI